MPDLEVSYRPPILPKSVRPIPHPSSSTLILSLPDEASIQMSMHVAPASSELWISSWRTEGYVGMIKLERRVVEVGLERGVIRPVAGLLLSLSILVICILHVIG